MGFSLRKLGEDIFSVLGNAGNQAQQVLGNVGHAVQQAPQQVQQAVAQAPQQIQRTFIQPQAQFVQRNFIQPVVPVARTMGSINRGIGIGINRGMQQSNDMMRPFAQPINHLKQDLFMPAKIATSYDMARKGQYMEALQNQIRVPLISDVAGGLREQAARSLGNKQAFGVTAQQIREPGFGYKALEGGTGRAMGAIQNVPGIKQGLNFKAPLSLLASAYGTPGAMVAEGAKLLNVAPHGISPREVGGFVSDNVIKPIVHSGADLSEYQQGTNAAKLGYTNTLQGAAKLGSDVYNVGSLAYTGAKAAELSAAAKPSAKLIANVAGRQFAAGSSANVMNQLAQGKKINEINPLEALGAGAAYSALGTGLPMAGKLLKPAKGALGSATQTAIANATSKVAKNVPNPVLPKVSLKGTEINDRALKIRPNPETMPGGIRPGVNTVRVGDVFDHPKLFEKYPQIKNADLNIEINPKLKPQSATIPDGLGGYSIDIKAPNEKLVKAKFIHEAQHYLDAVRGKPYSGTNPAEAQKFLKKAEVRLNKMGAELNPNQTPFEKTYDVYRRNIGEVRARNAEARINMTPAQRAAKPFETTMDTPAGMQLKYGSGGEAKSLPKIPKDLEPLAAEAKKYKSAEEFVKARGETLHTGAPKGIKEFRLPEGNGDGLMYGKGIYLTPDKKIASGYAGKTGQSYEVVADIKNPLTLKSKDWFQFIQQPTGDAKRNFLVKRGYDGVVDTSGRYKQVMAVNPEQVKTKAQLTDLYNQATGKGKTINELAPTPNSGLPKGYKLTDNGDVIDTKTGKQLTEGEIQKLTQPKALTQAENKLNAGKETFAQAEATTTKVEGKVYQLPATNKTDITKLPEESIISLKKQGYTSISDGNRTIQLPQTGKEQGFNIKTWGKQTSLGDTPIYHGGRDNFDPYNFSPGAKREAGTGGNRYGLSTSTDSTIAKDFSTSSTGSGKVTELNLRKGAKVYELTKGEIDDLSAKDIRQIAKQYDAIKAFNGGEQEVRVLNKSALAPNKPKVELKDKGMYSLPEPKKPLGSGSGDKKIGDLYEAQTASYFKDRGYNVTPVGKLKGALDNGIDVQATKGKELLLIQNKVRGEGKDVHLNTAALLWANAEKARKANPGKTVRPIIYTTEKLDTNATNFAKSKGIEIVHTPMPGAKASNGVDNELYRMASQRIGQKNVDNALRDMPVKQRADALFQLSNPDSTLSKGLKEQNPNNFNTIIHNYYKAVDSEGSAQFASLQGISQKLKYADTPDQVKKIINNEYATWQKNVPAGTKNPLLEGLLGRLDDKKFVNSIVQERNAMKLSRIIDDAANLEPISARFERPRGMRVSMKKDLPNDVPLESTPKVMTSGEYGQKPYGYNKTVANSQFTSEPTKVALEATAPTRGVLSNKQIAAKAREMVAADTNSARQYAEKNNDALSEVVGSYLIKHYNDTGDIGNATGLAISQAAKHLEAGRFNQAASMFNKLDPIGIQKYAAGQIMKSGKKMTEEQSQQLVHMAKKLQSMPDGEEKQAMMQEMFNVIGKAKGSAMTDKVIALWKSGLLSGPVTTTGNLASNTSKAIVKKLVDDPLSAVYDLGFRLLTGKRTKTFTYRGEGAGLKEGTIRGGKYMKTGVDIRNPIDKFDEKQVYFSDHWYGKTAQKYSDTVFRWMGAQDQPYFYASLRNNLYDMAIAEAKNNKVHGQARDKFIKQWIDNTPDDKMAQAMEEARQSVFANKTVLSQLAARVNQSPNPAVKAIGNFLMPFSKVPSAVAMEIMDRTPVGVAKEVIKQLYNAKKLGTGFDQRAMSQALGKSTTGTIGFMGAGFALQGAGLMTLAMPTTDAERNQWELEGKQPYSIKVGNNWLSTNYIQPFGSLLAMGAQFHKSLDDPKEGGFGSALTAATFAGAQSVTQQTFLKGVGSALTAMTDPSQAESWLNQTAGSIVPNAVGTVARAFDPLQRQVNGPMEAIASRIPGVREQLLPKLNVFGQEIARPSSTFNTLFNPLKPSQVLNTPFTDELARLASVDNAVLPASFNKGAFKDGKLSPDQINQLTKMVGPDALSAWQSIMADPRYAKLSDENKAKALKNAYSAISQGGRYTFAQQNGLGFTEYDKLSGDTKRYLNGETIGIKDEKVPKAKSTKAKVARSSGRSGGRSSGRVASGGSSKTKVLNPRQYALKLSMGSIARPKVGLKSTGSSGGSKRVAIAKPTVSIKKSLV